MKRFLPALVMLLVSLLSLAAYGQGALLPLPEDKPIRGMRYPTLSPDGRMVCFSYQGDLWTVPSAGGIATRLTIHPAHDGYPRYSPDGQWIAFTSSREGSYDLYIIPATGGNARRLTFHTAGAFPNDWSPDGTRILFSSAREEDSLQQCSVDVTTGVVKTLTHDDQYLRYGAYSPDGRTIAYNRSGGIGVWWRPRYHGSANFDIYTRDLTTGEIRRITDYDGNDLWPMYAPDGKTLYYISDQLTPGSPNVVARTLSGGGQHLITRQVGDAIHYPNIARKTGSIIYEMGGDIYIVSPKGGVPVKLNIIAREDDRVNNQVHLNLAGSATEVEISPDGKTIALVIRGDIWVIPADKGGDAVRLTTNPANDFDIIWSPDSSRIAFASDRKGNYDIYTIDVKTKVEKVIAADPADENTTHWSPDGKTIAYLRSGAQAGLWVTNVDGSGSSRRVAESYGNNLFNVGISDYSWSPDSKWLAFSRRDVTNTVDIWIVPASKGDPINVTLYPGTNSQPEWSSDGKYLLFLSDRNRPDGADLFSLRLEKEKEEPDTKPATPAPAAPAPVPAPPAAPTPGAVPPGAVPPAAVPPAPKKAIAVKIDFDDIENRAKQISSQSAGAFQITPDGTTAIFISANDYWTVSVSGGSVQRLTTSNEGTGLPRFSLVDSNRFYALGAGGTVKSIARSGGAVSQIAFSARLEIDLRSERREAFNEFWRRVNVGFYDPKMHGVDWAAMRTKYEPLLQSVGTREEFSLILSEMVGELNASHSEVGPAPAPGPPAQQTAELGLKFDESYPGPGLRVSGYMPKGPDDDLGPKIKINEYVLQIDGQDVTWNEKMWDPLLGREGKIVELLVNSVPKKEGARTVKLKAINSEQWHNLDYDRMVKEARVKVDKLSNGRLAYIHIRAMDRPSLKKLERELWGLARTKEGLVLDIRHNGGGNTHDEILSQISRQAYAYTQPRDAPASTQPFRHWDKPTILLIDQNSASDGEIFPAGFRQLKLGKILGVTTPGYVIGTYSGVLLDGTSYRIPMWGWYTLDGKNLENNGVHPDITVVPTPEDIAANRDSQLEAAVKELMPKIGAKKM